MNLAVPILTVLLIGSLAAILYLVRRRDELARERALTRRIHAFAPPPATDDGTNTRAARARAWQDAHPMLIPWDPLHNLGPWLAQAGLEIAATRFLILTLLLGLIGATITELWLGGAMAAAYGLGLAAVPPLYVIVKRRKRLAIFSQQLPYVLDFMRSALGAGHTLLRGVQMASENSPEPIATELRLVVEQIRLGASLSDALENMFRRAPEDSLGFLVAAVRVQAEVGSSIAEILDRVTDTIRDRQRLQQEIRTLTAQTRMSGMIVSGLPFALLGLFTLVRPGYTKPLFHDPLGIKMLEAAIVLDAIAMLVMRHMVRVDD